MAEGTTVRAESYLAPETLVQLAPFTLRAKMIVEGVMSGMHRSPYQGMAVEFAEHRQYVAGDDPKHLDWKVYARTDKLYIKQYQQETNLDVIVMIDASASMGYGSLEVKQGWGGTTASGRMLRWTKFDHATALATAVAHLCLGQQDRIGLAVFADDILALVARSSAQDQWRRIVNALRVMPVESGTDLRKVADKVLGKVQNRALFIIISDFFEDEENVRQMLARFKHRRHDVLLVNTLDREEMRFGFRDPTPFEGLEGEGRLRVDPRAIREGYLAALRRHLDAVSSHARAFGFDEVRVDTHESVGPPLAYVLARRGAMLKRSGVI
ncbi:MAG: DUF58 domain-containing protein [Phycisphaeraceae bacterium]|nr:DUF58 domain-containing protein [Phycisphaeraceae bacterium]